ncbi:MAG: hypothetical protein ACD_71C00154G0003 [uncultured bacterium (gcode 4)]|uniref:Uncharacterized protein n=1 Tax=uncultured bacterium (gcode 4) TaxID=1234023 RepID=K1Z524_9BACT|nr:MAG: hypothetical protein ACD_71C00154G0003 [uncultured bacterium (gcode 4)]
MVSNKLTFIYFLYKNQMENIKKRLHLKLTYQSLIPILPYWYFYTKTPYNHHPVIWLRSTFS